VLARAGVTGRDRRLIALFGPRGLSSLLLTLLPVFAGIAGAEQLFTITCLVVLMSVVLHGGGVALFLRTASRASTRAAPASVPLPVAKPEIVVPEKITIGEFRALRERGDPFVVVDARAGRSWQEDDITAAGSVRLNPDDAVRDAREKRLSQRATLVVYCA
jgi:hypothetical protein